MKTEMGTMPLLLSTAYPRAPDAWPRETVIKQASNEWMKGEGRGHKDTQRGGWTCNPSEEKRKASGVQEQAVLTGSTLQGPASAPPWAITGLSSVPRQTRCCLLWGCPAAFLDQECARQGWGKGSACSCLQVLEPTWGHWTTGWSECVPVRLSQEKVSTHTADSWAQALHNPPGAEKWAEETLFSPPQRISF